MTSESEMLTLPPQYMLIFELLTLQWLNSILVPSAYKELLVIVDRRNSIFSPIG